MFCVFIEVVAARRQRNSAELKIKPFFKKILNSFTKPRKSGIITVS